VRAAARDSRAASQDAAAVERIRVACQDARKQYGPNVTIRCDVVLDMLNPRGEWRTRTELIMADQGDVDPMTGTKSVRAPGS
jgi:hypothetical protein